MATGQSSQLFLEAHRRVLSDFDLEFSHRATVIWQRNTVVATVPVGNRPIGVAFTPGGAFAYVTNFSSNNVSVISTATNTVVATVAVGAGAEGVAITPDGSSVYVVNTNGNSVSVIDTATNTVIATTSVGNLPILVAITPDRFASLIAQVQALVDAGVLTQTQGDKLIKKVEAAQAKLANGHTGAAIGQLTAFISQVQDLIDNGTLTAAQGQALINAANALINSFSPLLL